ncbi:Alcohol dehydrogenase superfamily, zinc-type [Ascosphaera apis ARSEF 7405]|uniref:Alcohol dehydrogenase superfamily, zinc-type n=1 Tax=Ascosphaera apis ARSEF 7405 TaxID=392613 RepID=A0A166PP76_9EURO|nr:Alcohol dehydrogenase superfamily, zinc-type [Ascosphaera apis ARSEF 7405]
MAEVSTAAISVPKRGVAGVVTEYGPDFKLAVEEVDVPEPGPDDLLICLNTTGVCYSDIHCIIGDLTFPRIDLLGVRSPGHEGAGVVVKIGTNVQGWKVGDRAGVKPIRSVCFNCGYCWNMAETACPSATYTGITQPGTYQRYMTNPAIYTTRIPDGVDDFSAAPIMCAGSTMYQCIVDSGLKWGNILVILGAGGGVGHLGVQIGKALGYRIIGVDAGESKRSLCMSLGCEAFADITQTKDIVAEVLKASDGIGAHGVIVTAGSKAAYESAPKMLRVGGTVICVGLPPAGTVVVGADPNEIVLRRIAIKGSFVGSMLSTERCLELVQRGLVKPNYEVFPVKSLPDAVNKLKNGQVAGRCVVDFNA